MRREKEEREINFLEEETKIFSFACLMKMFLKVKIKSTLLYIEHDLAYLKWKIIEENKSQSLESIHCICLNCMCQILCQI